MRKMKKALLDVMKRNEEMASTQRPEYRRINVYFESKDGRRAGAELIEFSTDSIYEPLYGVSVIDFSSSNLDAKLEVKTRKTFELKMYYNTALLGYLYNTRNESDAIGMVVATYDNRLGPFYVVIDNLKQEADTIEVTLIEVDVSEWDISREADVVNTIEVDKKKDIERINREAEKRKKRVEQWANNEERRQQRQLLKDYDNRYNFFKYEEAKRLNQQSPTKIRNRRKTTVQNTQTTSTIAYNSQATYTYNPYETESTNTSNIPKKKPEDKFTPNCEKKKRAIDL